MEIDELKQACRDAIDAGRESIVLVLPKGVRLCGRGRATAAGRSEFRGVVIMTDVSENELIRQAASDCLDSLRATMAHNRQPGGAMMKVIRSGTDWIRVRVSIVNEDKCRERLQASGLNGIDSEEE